MSNELTVLVCGIGEDASAVARGLFGEGYAVALHKCASPLTLRRRMSFADAWYDGYAVLDGVEARRADVASEFMLGLQSRAFIPLLRGQLADVIERWPWHVIVAAREDKEDDVGSFLHLAEFTIGLGSSFAPGLDCDMAIATHGPDPGAILRAGDIWPKEWPETQNSVVFAPVAGQFRADMPIGALATQDAPVGYIGETPVLAPLGGRVVGIARREQAVAEGAPIAEIAENVTARVAGVSRRSQLVARAASFAIELENEGIKPFSFEDWG